MQYVYVTAQCQQDAARIGMTKEVERLRQKLLREQKTLGLERHPKPFLKKALGKMRLIIAELFDGDDVVLCFLSVVYKHEIGEDYDRFFRKLRVPRADDPEVQDFLREARTRPIEGKPEPSVLELEYLSPRAAAGGSATTVLESSLWTRAINALRDTPGKQGLLTPIWEVLHRLCDQPTEQRVGTTEIRHERHPIRVLYHCFSEPNMLFLVAPLEGGTGGPDDPISGQAGDLMDEACAFGEQELLRHAVRAYPDFVVYDRQIWETMQTSIEANLALSPEEKSVLDHVLNPASGGFPLFINGRPGSGKSTILQYLFAEYLHAHLARRERLPKPPLYLTYNERLLQSARRVVEDIFQCGADKLAASEPVNLQNAEQRAEFNGAFAEFRGFLLSLVPNKERFARQSYVDFHQFRSHYQTLLQGPDARLRRLSPEVAWHTLRTYIKGKSSGFGEYFDPSNYAQLPRDEITVDPETFELVWDKVWNGWYRQFCENEGHWDDQDLARHVLDSELPLAAYPGIFCDEAQDFTTVELELIFRLSCFAAKALDAYYLRRIPFAFAGDPFQTLNPTGFRWDAIKANFHDNIITQLDPARRAKVEVNFRELAYNYRSTKHIVHFCNLIQLQRAELFSIQDVVPQQAWGLEEGGLPAYFDVGEGMWRERLRDQRELVIIVPCQEGEEKAFVETDDFLCRIAINDRGEIVRNVLSPMRAKGLEFARVVLYKFGDSAVREGHVGRMAELNGKGTKELRREDTLGLEYYFNGVYVAASRAQKRLMIVDTAEGLHQFWSFATDTKSMDGLLTARRRKSWDHSDVRLLMRGGAEAWIDRDRDVPKDLADRFFEQGKAEASVYLLQLARNQYEALGDEERQARCTALISEIEERFQDAARSFLELGELMEAIRCYWNAGDFAKVIEVSERDRGRFAGLPEVMAARFQTGPKTTAETVKFIKALSLSKPDLGCLIGRVERWPDVVGEAVDVLAGTDDGDDALGPADVGEAYRAIEEIQEHLKLRLTATEPFARLAFWAGQHDAALGIWERIERRSGAREPRYITRARAEVSAYPGKLRFLERLGDHDAIVAAYREYGGDKLDAGQRDIVLSAMLATAEFDLATELVKKGADVEGIRKLLVELPDGPGAGQDLAKQLLASYVMAAVRQGAFRRLFGDIVNVEPDAPDVLIALLREDAMRLRIEAVLLKVLGRSDELSRIDRKDSGYVSGKLLRVASRDPRGMQQFVSVDEAGAAIERAGRVDNALRFYEAVYKDHAWGKSRGVVEFAKERWLRCKGWQAEVTPGRARRSLQERDRMSREWGVPVPETEYPTLPGMTIGDLDEILCTETAPTLGEGGGAAVATGSGVVPGVAAEPESVRERQNPSARGSFEGKVAVAFTVGDRRIELVCLPAKARIEARDGSSGDLVMILGRKSEVSSPDLVVERSANGTWWIPAWGISIELAALSGRQCAEFLTDDDKTIVCLVIS